MVSLPAAVMAALFAAPGQTVLLDFYADWCGPCRAMNSTVDGLVAKGYPVQRVNVDQNRELAQQLHVESLPCFVMVVGGQEVDRVVGGTSYSRLERMCKMAAAPTATSPSALVQDPFPPNSNRAATPVTPVSLAATSGAMPPQATMPTGDRAARPTEMRAADPALVAASVRLRIEESPGRFDVGTGTIIDARNGEALILTCGHVFRDSQGKGQIEVDLFGPSAGQRAAGRLIAYDLDSDLGLVAINTTGPVATARVAPPGYRMGQDESVISVGCDGGASPTLMHSRITAVDKFVGPANEAGPRNFQVAGQPQQGRSGGGLFTEDGLLIGVCNAADPTDEAGLFAGLGLIQAQLDRADLAFVYKGSKDALLTARNEAPAAPPSSPLRPAELPSMPRQMPSSLTPTALGNTSTTAAAAPGAEERAAVEEIRKRLQEGAEVVCVIRSRKDPGAKSEVITLSGVTPDFFNQLYAATKLPALDGTRRAMASSDAVATQGVSFTSHSAVPILPAVRSTTPANDTRPGRLEWKSPVLP